MKILLRFLFLMGVLNAGQITVPAAGTSSTALPVRCLFLIDTSQPLAEHKSDILDAVSARLDTGLSGQLRAGDVFLIRTFGETAHGTDLQGVWNPQSRQTIPQALAGVLAETSFKGRARLDLALKSAADFAARSEELLVVIVTDAATPFRGTPFDSRINGVRQQIPRDQSRATPMVVALLAGSGRLVGWSVEPLSSSAIPAEPSTPTPVVNPTLAAPVRDWKAPTRRPETTTPVTAPAHAPSPTPSIAAAPNPTFKDRTDTRTVPAATNPPGSTPIKGELPIPQAPPAKQQEPESAASGDVSVESALADVVATPGDGPSRVPSVPTETVQTVAVIPEIPTESPPASEDLASMAATIIPEVPLDTPPVPAHPAAEAQSDVELRPKLSNATPTVHAESVPALPVQEVQPPPRVQATPPASAAEPLRTSSLAFLILGSSLIAAAGVGLWCFARRRKPAPAQSLISRSIDAVK